MNGISNLTDKVYGSLLFAASLFCVHILYISICRGNSLFARPRTKMRRVKDAAPYECECRGGSLTLPKPINYLRTQLTASSSPTSVSLRSPKGCGNPHPLPPPQGCVALWGDTREWIATSLRSSQRQRRGNAPPFIILVYIKLLIVEIKISPATTRSSAAKPSAKLSEYRIWALGGNSSSPSQTRIRIL